MDRERGYIEGLEVEGRLSGVPSLFVQPAAPVERLIPILGGRPDLAHVYFCPRADVAEQVRLARSALRIRSLVTVAVGPTDFGALPSDIRESCHIQLILDVPAARYLKQGDEVRLDVGGFGQALILDAQCARPARPWDYAGDKEI